MDRSISMGHVGGTLQHLYRQWESRRKAEEDGAARAVQCTVAIAREAGTQGAAIAYAVGKQLNWPVFDRELVDLIAAEMKLRVEDVRRVDERPLGWLLETMEAFGTENFASENAYVKFLGKTVLTLGKYGGCIIVGRGAAHILPPDRSLRVRLVAPLTDRVETLASKLGVSRKEAEQKAARMDRERTQFVQKHFLKDPHDPTNYDLILNTARFTLEEAARLITEAVHQWEENPSPRHLQQAAQSASIG